MEIVLQWLDELDDAVFSIVLAWEKLRRRLIALGVGAALGVAGAAALAWPEWVAALAGVATAALAAVVAGGAFTAFAENVSVPPPRA